jgi:hypothetical protein
MGVDQVMDPVQELCATVGVAVVVVPALRSTGISGCARWLTEKRALIGLTLRYKTDDQLWFTFFHELGHLLLHRSKKPFVVDNAEDDLSESHVGFLNYFGLFEGALLIFRFGISSGGSTGGRSSV